MKNRFYKSNWFFVTIGYVIFLIAIYFVVFTYWVTVSLLASSLISIFILIRVVKTTPKFFSIFFSLILIVINLSCTAIDINNSLKVNTQIETLFVDGEEREYRYYLPSKFYESSDKICVIALHGFMQTAATMERLTRFNDYADSLGFMVVYPEGYMKSWNDGDDTKPATRENKDDVGFISEIISKLSKEKSIDGFYLTGFSNGGFLAVDAACSLSNLIDGFAVVAAGTWKGNLKNCNSPSVSKSMFILMKEDPLTKWRQFGNSAVNYLKKFDCYSNATKDTIISNNTFTVIDYKCNETVTREAIFEKGGHVWPGGGQYLPSFIVGNAIDDIDVSELILNFWFDNTQ